jgi:general secretion pathway protein H
MAATARQAVRMKTPISVADLTDQSGDRITTPSLHAGARGFTLLELLVVLSIIMVSVGLIIPSVISRDNNAFNAQVRQAVAVLTYARRVAIVEAAPRTARFYALDPESDDFEEKKDELDAARQPTQWVTEVLQLGFQTDPNQREEPADELKVTFFPQGGSTGGVLNFVQNNRSAKVWVDPLTGRIATAYNGEELDDAF